MKDNSCQVTFVGAGPGDPELITVKGRRCIMEADLVLYAGSLVPRDVLSCARKGARLMDSSSMTLEEIHETIMEVVRSGGRVARVHTGDPSLYGAVKEQMGLLDRDKVPYRVIPGVTAGFAAAAAAKVSLTVPEATQTVIFTRAAGRIPVPVKEELKGLAAHQCTIVIYLSAAMVDEVARALLEGGYAPDTTVVVGHRIGWEDETVLVTTLSRLEEEAKDREIKRQAVFLVLPGEKGKARSRLYDSGFSHGFRQSDRGAEGDGGSFGMALGRTALYAFTRKGARLGRLISEALKGDLYLPERFAREFEAIPFSALGSLLQSIFQDYGAHVFVGATGVAVRTIAPFMRSKDRDPGAVVVDQEGRHVISLLSGHLGGANELARKIAGITGGEAVITTATDLENLPSVDMLALEKGMAIGNLEAIKPVNGAILEGGPIQVFDPEDRVGLGGGLPGTKVINVDKEEEWRPGIPGVWVTWRVKAPVPGQLVLHPKCLAVGLGCNRGTTAREICRAIRDLFASWGLDLQSLLGLYSIDLKRDEEGLIEAASLLRTEIRFFRAEQLDRVKVPNPSDMAKKHVGAQSVCEAAARMGAWGGELMVPKRKSGNVTLAVAVAP